MKRVKLIYRVSVVDTLKNLRRGEEVIVKRSEIRGEIITSAIQRLNKSGEFEFETKREPRTDSTIIKRIR